jgi:hypothetical protein
MESVRETRGSQEVLPFMRQPRPSSRSGYFQAHARLSRSTDDVSTALTMGERGTWYTVLWIHPSRYNQARYDMSLFAYACCEDSVRHLTSLSCDLVRKKRMYGREPATTRPVTTAMQIVGCVNVIIIICLFFSHLHLAVVYYWMAQERLLIVIHASCI